MVEGPPAGLRAAVLGHPIAHSLSPILHRAAYEALGLTGWSYVARDVDADGLPGVIASLDDRWAGLSLTMPLKQRVIALLDEVSDLAVGVGAVNTVVPAGAGRWRGDNTDVHGVCAALAAAGARDPRTAVVLGAGATAASALAALARMGVEEVLVLVRSPQRARDVQAVAARIGIAVELAHWPREPVHLAPVLRADLVVATAPAGAADTVASLIASAPGRGPHGILLDVVYEPRPTALQAAWSAAGGDTGDGTDMLLHQAARQVELMTGCGAPVAAMRAALRGAIAGSRRFPARA